MCGALVAGCSGGQTPAPESSAPSPSAPSSGDDPSNGDDPSHGDDPSSPDASPSASAGASGDGTSAPSSDADQGTLAWDEAVTRAQALVADLDTEALAGQVIVAGYEGTSGRDAARLVQDGFGGVIAFKANIPADPLQLRQVNDAVQAAQEKSGRSWPAVIGIDQEGGPVQRISRTVTQWPAGMAHGAAHDPDLSTQVARHSGEQLRALGFTMVFAPDADVTMGPQDPTIGVRSPGSDAQRVAQVVQALSAGYRQSGIVPVVKHFPGHGALTTDSHEGLPATDASLEQLDARDFVPFAAVAQDDVPVMVGHIALTQMDSLPATLSPEVTGLLRKRLDTDALVVTDALNMGALDVAEVATGHDRSVAAMLAGSDLLLMPPDPQGARTALVEAVQDGTLPQERLREAAARVVAASLQVGQTPSAQAATREDGGLAGRLAAASLTSIGATCDPAVLQTGQSVRVVGGTAQQRAGLGEALATAGLRVGREADTVVRVVDGGDYAAGKVDDGSMPGASDGPAGSGAGAADVAVALDVPYGLESVEAPVKLAAFGDTPEHLLTVAEALVGRATPGGTLPVAVGDVAVGQSCQ